MSQEHQTPRPANKQRVSLTLDPEAVRMGEELAKEEKRSLSNMIEVLFEREHKRMVKAAAEAPQAA
jgi:hypothetical protein